MLDFAVGLEGTVTQVPRSRPGDGTSGVID